MSYRRVLICSPIVRIDRSARPLLAELCRGQVSTKTHSGIFAFTFSATTMIEDSLSQRSLNFPTNKFFHEVCHRACQAIYGSFLSLTLSLACIRCSSRRLPEMSTYRHRLPPSSARPLLTAKSTAMMCLSSRCHVPVCKFHTVVLVGVVIS